MAQARWGGLAVVLLASLVSLDAASAAPRLERVVIVMRHGVRPPTKTAQALKVLSDQPWPDEAAWGAAPGDLTPHGAAAIGREAQALRAYYAQQGLFSTDGPTAAQTVIWADGGDERTRATARAAAGGLSPKAPLPVGFAPAGRVDPLFDGAAEPGCAIDPAKALAAVQARGPVDTLQVEAALARLQQIVAPDACHGGAGACLAGPSTLAAGREVKIDGPLATGATLAEDLLLEYENDLPLAQVGWGRLQAGDLAQVMPAHDRAAALTRQTPYIAVRRAGPLARFVLAALEETAPAASAPVLTQNTRLVVLVGHDTNLSNLAGTFGLDWSLTSQPDATAPGVAVAFERWREAPGGQAWVRVQLFYQTPDEVRSLSPTLEGPAPVSPSACAGRDCPLAVVASAVRQAIPNGCGPD